MDLGETLVDSALQVICPQCGHTEVDDLELLGADEIHALTCEVCACRFHLALLECAHCGEETVIVQGPVPTPAELRAMSCGHCGHRLRDDGQDVRPMGDA